MSVYNADGQINTTEVDGSTYVGLYAADGSINIVVDSAGTGVYHPSGALRVSSGTGPGLYDPSGSLYLNKLYGVGGEASEAAAWPPASDDLATVLEGTTRIWHEPFDVLSLRTGGYASGLTTGYNDPNSRGIWAPNGQNFMTSATQFTGANSYSRVLNHASSAFEPLDSTFPTLALYDITAEGLELRATGDYPAIRAALPTISGNVPYLGSMLTTMSSAKFRRPYVIQVKFTFKTMTDEEFPAIWTLGEHYALDIDDPTFKHYEIDLIERFGADYADDIVSIHSHINGQSRGGQYDTNVALGPDVENTITILHTEEYAKAWFNGIYRTTMTHPVGQQYTNDRDFIILNQLIGMSWRAYPATHPDAVMVVHSVEIFKPEAVALDLIPPTPPVPVLTGFSGTISNADPNGTVVGTLSGADSYRVIGYDGLEVVGSNLQIASWKAGGDYSFYIEGLAADGTPGIPPAYALTVTDDAPPPNITFVGSATGTAVNGGNASINVGGIAGLQAGDFLLIFGGGNTRTTTVGNASTNGTGALTHSSSISNGVRARLAYKHYDNDTTVTIQGTGNSFDSVAGLALAFRNVSTVSPLDTAIVSATGATTVDPPAVTTVTPNVMVIAAGAGVVNDATPGSISGYSTTVFANASDTNGATVAAAYKEIATAGVENPAAFDGLAPATWVAFTTALRPG